VLRVSERHPASADQIVQFVLELVLLGCPGSWVVHSAQLAVRTAKGLRPQIFEVVRAPELKRHELVNRGAASLRFCDTWKKIRVDDLLERPRARLGESAPRETRLPRCFIAGAQVYVG